MTRRHRIRRRITLAYIAAALLLFVPACSGKPAGKPAPPTPSASPVPSSASAAPDGYLPGVAVPDEVLATCQQLVSGTPDQQRAALTPELAAALPAGELFPAGATFVVDDMSWRAENGFATATGTLRDPGQPAQHVRIGFAQQQSGSWLVSFEQPIA